MPLEALRVAMNVASSKRSQFIGGGGTKEPSGGWLGMLDGEDRLYWFTEPLERVLVESKFESGTWRLWARRGWLVTGDGRSLKKKFPACVKGRPRGPCIDLRAVDDVL